MSGFGDIGLAAAERLETTSPRMALPSYKTLLGGSDKRVVLAAALGVWRCALATEDADALAEHAVFWATLSQLDAFWPIARLAKASLAVGRSGDAATLVAAEIARCPSAEVYYLHARAMTSLATYRRAVDAVEAIAEADRTERQQRIAAWSRCVLLRDALQDASDPAACFALARGVDLAMATPPQKLMVAGVLLGAPSRFVRARALSALEDLAASDTDAVAKRAVRIAARHADAAGTTLSWVESERVAATIAKWQDATERKQALAHLDSLTAIAAADDKTQAAAIAGAADQVPDGRRYHDVAGALVEAVDVDIDAVSKEAPPQTAAAYAGLSAIAAIRRDDHRSAQRTLSSLPTTIPKPPPRALWSAALLALHGADAKLRIRAREVVATLAPLGPPPRGYLPYVTGATALDRKLLRRAAARKEGGAADMLANLLIADAWRVADSDRLAALKLLRRARSLASGG